MPTTPETTDSDEQQPVPRQETHKLMKEYSEAYLSGEMNTAQLIQFLDWLIETLRSLFRRSP